MGQFVLGFGIIIFAIGFISVVKSHFSEPSRYSWKMAFLVGGIAWINLYFLLSYKPNVLPDLLGNWVLSVILLVIGFVFIIWRKRVALAFYKPQLPILKALLGWVVDFERPWVVKALSWMFLVAGTFLLIGAWANYYSGR